MFQQLLDELKVVPIDVLEMIDLFYEISNDDPQKFDYYRNIISILEVEVEREKSSRLRIRLMNERKSGQIALSQLANTANNLQEAYTSALGKSVGIIDGRNSRYQQLRNNSEIIASTEAGSFVIAINKIGENNGLNQGDMFIDELNKEEIFTSLISDIDSLVSEENFNKYIDKYGYKSVKFLKSWLGNLNSNNIEFELINSNKWKKKFDKKLILDVNNFIKDINFTEDTNLLRVSGRLLTIDSIKNRLIINDVVYGHVDIRLPSGILQSKDIGEDLKLNNTYSFEVTQQIIKYPGRTVVNYFYNPKNN